MGMAKTVEQVAPQPVVTKSVPSIFKNYISGIPFEIYRYFNVDMNNISIQERRQLEAITEWASIDSDSPETALSKITKIERSVGAPDVGERRFNRVFNIVRLKLNRIKLEEQYSREKARLEKLEAAHKGAHDGTR